jgi:hypothetical protein
MASTQHKNRRRALALEELNIAVAQLAEKHGIEPVVIPKRMRDRDMLEIVTFEKIGAFLKGLAQDLPEPVEHPLVQRRAQRVAKPLPEAKPKAKAAKKPVPKTASSSSEVKA